MNIDIKQNNIRIDQYLSEELEISRSKVQKLIKEGKVLINGKSIKANYLLKEEDKLFINADMDYDITIEPENIFLDIVYEDEYLLIINKKSGMVVHPAPGHYHETLVNALLFYLNQGCSTNLRPGIVHRLDKDTSGVMVVAK